MTHGLVAIPLEGQPMDGGVKFVAGPENYLVEPAIENVLHDRVAAYNPLVLCGPSGTGKSHLARGLAAAWRKRFPEQAVVYTTAVDFARELADAIETQAVVDLRKRYRTAGLLVFEDAGRLADKPAAQVELIHTLDAVMRRGGQVVVTASTAPARCGACCRHCKAGCRRA